MSPADDVEPTSCAHWDVSQGYRRTGKTSISYRIFVGNERYRSFQTCCREDMTDDARAMRRIISAWLPPLEDWVLPRYTKLSTCSTVFPSTVMFQCLMDDRVDQNRCSGVWFLPMKHAYRVLRMTWAGQIRLSPVELKALHVDIMTQSCIGIRPAAVKHIRTVHGTEVCNEQTAIICLLKWYAGE